MAPSACLVTSEVSWGEIMERTVGEWCLITQIGSGSFAIVWKAKHRLTGQEAAIKEIALDRLNGKLRQSLESEVSILKRITHENIVKLLEVFEVGQRNLLTSCSLGSSKPQRPCTLRAHRPQGFRLAPPPSCRRRTSCISSWNTAPAATWRTISAHTSACPRQSRSTSCSSWRQGCARCGRTISCTYVYGEGVASGGAALHGSLSTAELLTSTACRLS
jgi:hypothetical protein